MPGNPFTDPNWAPELADTVERVVGTVREKATVKAVTIVRALVFGIIIGVASIVALVLVVTLSTKLLQRVLNIGDVIEHDSAVGISYLLIGALLALGGFVCMGRRSPKESR
jgi:VIT1/CCC1 family predicted Fe2+/Mn2+ transporter